MLPIRHQKVSSCVLCDAPLQNSTIFTAHEKLIGTYHEFQYSVCQCCLSLTLVNPPTDIEAYYPRGYYSFNQSASSPSPSFLKKTLRKLSMKGKLGSKSLSSAIALKLRPIYYPWIKGSHMKHNDSILDVGCGSGALLQELYNYGFKNLFGVDPFIQEKKSEGGGPIIARSTLLELPLNSKYDVIMFNHSLEHVDNPRKILSYAKDLLNINGRILIRIPVANSFAFRKYRHNWVNLDPPRHLFVPTIEGLSRLLLSCGLRIVDSIYDSNSFQFSGSEDYQLGRKIALPCKAILNNYDSFSHLLNSINDGDMVCLWVT